MGRSVNPYMFNKRRNVKAVVLAASALALIWSTASADVESRWPFFGQNNAITWERPFDRSAAREWEKNPPKGHATLSKRNIEATKEAIKRYSAIVKKGGWARIPDSGLDGGDKDKVITTLREHLVLTGDLREDSGFAKTFDYYVERAVQRFQKRNGLSPTGKLDKRTVAALNVSAKVRLHQLQTNLGRLRALSSGTEKRYVLVNIPAAQIEAVDNDEVISRHAAVVGKRDRQSPLLVSRVHEINFNPYWHVPQSIVRKDLVPTARKYAKRGKDILKVFRINAYNGDGRKLNSKKINWFSPAVYNYSYRQDPWKDNSMGFVKINFHNAHSVYLHDTPSKRLFGRNFRAHSSGCVRVQNVKQLVSWLLKDNEGWERSRVDRMKESGEQLDVRLTKSVQIRFAYLTAWATEDGVVQFRRDLYRRDGVGATASAY